jgi:hypothetical protein
MDFHQFMAALAKSLAWPMTIVMSVIFLRKPLAELIVSLRSLKYKDLSLEFDRKLEKLGIEVADVVQSVEPGGPRIEAIQAEQPWKQIVDAWSEVEKALKDLAENAGIPPASLYNSPIDIARALEDKGKINPATMKILYELYELRNTAMHFGENMTSDQAKRYIVYAGVVIWALRARLRKV